MAHSQAQPDANDLKRFVWAQRPCISNVESELRAGLKQSHWMWFIFPQLRSLGRTQTALYFGLEDLQEAQSYYRYDPLGTRLVHCFTLVLEHWDKSAIEIMGKVDAKKLRSCASLFHLAVPEQPLFRQCLDVFYGGALCERTRTVLEEGEGLAT
ncbi:DUF1810 domain-containing protein [Polycladidibacter stylochi]|uniref:DUF1810 domain-containing protein n=1 Tax=Polycladidibacter stylochi TaxID=1807766 RepID=UPI00082E0C77|nr:DUF1810 family protein [Pseudovibrio stylochi]